MGKKNKNFVNRKKLSQRRASSKDGSKKKFPGNKKDIYAKRKKINHRGLKSPIAQNQNREIEEENVGSRGETEEQTKQID